MFSDADAMRRFYAVAARPSVGPSHASRDTSFVSG